MIIGGEFWMWDIVLKNGMTNAALTDILSVYLGGGTQKATWYLGLIDDASTITLAAADTISSHSGWSENTDYDEAARPTWTPAAAAGQIIQNNTAVNFTMTGSGTVRGIFMVSNNTKGGSTGVLLATALLATPRSYSPGEVIPTGYKCKARGG